MAYGFIPMAWRHVKVIFIPKPKKLDYNKAKPYRPVSLSSFLLKTMEKLVDRHVRDWTNIYHIKQWESTIGLKQAKGLISWPSARRMTDLLKLNRVQLRWMVGLLTGHCHLKGQLSKLGLTDNPTCDRYLEDESATHILLIVRA
jgi:hypothetical protein